MIKVKKAVIAAAGLGTRFLPITKAVPKPMLPIVDKPNIQYIVEEISSSGIEEIIIVISSNNDTIREHFSTADYLEKRLLESGKKELYDIAVKTRNLAKITFVEQENLNGLAGAVLCAEKLIGTEPFALLLGDELYDTTEEEKPCIKQLIDVFEETGISTVATLKVGDRDISKYGNLKSDDYSKPIKKVLKVVEKPKKEEAFSEYGVVGRYVFDNKVLEYLKKAKMQDNELYLTDGFNYLAENEGLLAYEFKGKRYDVGDKLGYLKANIDFALKDEKIGAELKEYIEELR